MSTNKRTAGMAVRMIGCFVMLHFAVVTTAQTQQGSANNSKNEKNTNSDKQDRIHVGLIYPISTNGLNAGSISNKFSLHLLAGLSRSETGATFSGFTSVIRQNASGFQSAGFSNHIGGNASGVQLAGFINTISGHAQGFQAAGFANVSGTMKNSSTSDSSNTAFYKEESVQLAGFGNFGKDVESQLSGFANVARNVEGTQIAGFINVAKKVKGVQISGFLNIADSSEYPIGVVNIIKNGERAIGVTFDEITTTLLTFRSGSKHLYGILGVGYNFKANNDAYALEAGFGARVNVSKAFRLNAEITQTVLHDFKSGHFTKSGIRVLPSFSIGDKLELFAGPSISYAYFTESKYSNLVEHFIWSQRTGRKNFEGVYIGALAGLQYKF